MTRGAAVVVPYDERWPAEYEREAELLRAALDGRVVALEHVGSTAVPGLAAKPVIDMLAGFEDEDFVPDLVPALRPLGYALRARAGRRHLRKGAPRTHTLHVVRHGGPEWRAALDFRDYLRSDARAAAAYGDLKLALARDASRGGYSAGKARFIGELVSSLDYERFLAGRRYVQSPP